MPGGDDAPRYSQRDLEEIVAKRVSDKLTEQLVATIKSTVNGLQTYVTQLGRDVRGLEDRLGPSFTPVSPEDRQVLDVMIEDYKRQIRRGVWYQTLIGRVALLAGIAAAVATVVGTAYLVVAGSAHPLSH